MTDEELAQIEARVAVAARGPWFVDEYLGSIYAKTNDGEELEVCSPDGFRRWEDRDFATHAREDIPALIAEVRRLRKIANPEQALTETAIAYDLRPFP